MKKCALVSGEFLTLRQRLSYCGPSYLMSTTLCGSRVHVCPFPPSVWWWALLTSLTIKRKVPSVLFEWDTVCVCVLCMHACRFNLPCLGLSGANFYRSSPPETPVSPRGHGLWLTLDLLINKHRPTMNVFSNTILHCFLPQGYGRYVRHGYLHSSRRTESWRRLGFIMRLLQTLEVISLN